MWYLLENHTSSLSGRIQAQNAMFIYFKLIFTNQRCLYVNVQSET